MLRAGYPAIQHETTTSIFRGLTARPPLVVHVPMMLAQRPPTVRKARRLIDWWLALHHRRRGRAQVTLLLRPTSGASSTNAMGITLPPSAAQCAKHKPKCIDRIQHKARPLPPDARVAFRDKRAAAARLAHGAVPATGEKRTLRSRIPMTAQITGMMHLTLSTLSHSNKSPRKPW